MKNELIRLLHRVEKKLTNEEKSRIEVRRPACINCYLVQGAAEKSGPLKFFAVFSATVWNFNLKFYRFI